MSLRDRLADEFGKLVAAAPAQARDECLDLLEEIGRLNGGLVAPPTDEDETYFASRVHHAMERQAIYYANVLGGRRNADFLSSWYLRELVASGSAVEDDTLRLSAFVRVDLPDVAALVASPTAATYNERFLERGQTLAASHRGDVVLDELTAVRDRLRSHAGAHPPARHANSFMLDGETSLLAAAGADVVGLTTTSRDRVAVLFNHVYFDALIEALDGASKSIAVLMFYFPYDGRRTRAVTTEVFRALVDARQRGVRVEVVLDRDRKDQKYGTRSINANAIRALRDAGVEARFDSEEHVTHSKIITVDDRLTFIGAHNLSSSASYRYEEVSLLIRSTSVGKYYRAFISAAS